MSRSRRRTPIMGMTCAESEKQDKQRANGALRTAVRDALRRGAELMPELREVSNICTFAKDGKSWRWQWEEGMRK